MNHRALQVKSILCFKAPTGTHIMSTQNTIQQRKEKARKHE